MAKFLYKANYTKAGLEGLLREGGSSRVKAIQMVAESMGGTVESMYWALSSSETLRPKACVSIASASVSVEPRDAKSVSSIIGAVFL